MNFSPIELIGWIADAIFVLAYFLVSRKKLEADGKLFNAMNLIGALLYSSYAIIKWTLPVLILEFFWGSIAIGALYRSYFKTKKHILVAEK